MNLHSDFLEKVSSFWKTLISFACVFRSSWRAISCQKERPHNKNIDPSFFPRTKNGRFTWKVFSKKLGRLTMCRCAGSDQRSMTPTICTPCQKSCLLCWVTGEVAKYGRVKRWDIPMWWFSGVTSSLRSLKAVTHATGSCWVFITNIYQQKASMTFEMGRWYNLAMQWFVLQGCENVCRLVELWMWQYCGNIHSAIISLKWLPSRWIMRFQMTKMNDFGCGYFFGPEEGRPDFPLWQSNSQMKPLCNRGHVLGALSTNIIVVGTSIVINWFVNLVYTVSTGVPTRERVWLEVPKTSTSLV